MLVAQRGLAGGAPHRTACEAVWAHAPRAFGSRCGGALVPSEPGGADHLGTCRLREAAGRERDAASLYEFVGRALVPRGCSPGWSARTRVAGGLARVSRSLHGRY